MKFKDIFALAIAMGMDADPRGEQGARRALQQVRADYEAAPERQRRFFDADALDNPYADSRVLHGDTEQEIGSMLVGIDIDLPELLLARELIREGEKIDLIMSHHPKGMGLASLHQVMPLQAAAWAAGGARLSEAQELLEPKMREVGYSVGSANYQRPVDAARMLGLNFMCVHTPCDNLVNSFVTALVEKEQPETVDDIIRLLLTVPEYAAAAERNNPPLIAAGGGRAAGKIFVDMTGGAEGPKEFYPLLAKSGISTVICMAAGHEMLEAAGDSHLNVVIAGHMASDSLGVNLFLDAVARQGVDIIPASGLIRISRD